MFIRRLRDRYGGPARWPSANTARRTKLDGTIRAAGTKASLVKVLREETGVSAVPNLPQPNMKTSV